jgi:hypothetical protein
MIFGVHWWLKLQRNFRLFVACDEAWSNRELSSVIILEFTSQKIKKKMHILG